MAVITYLEAIRSAMEEEMKRDNQVFVLGEDVGKGGVNNATKNLRDLYGEERVLDTPLAESAIVGVAIGAAMYGMKPIAEIQFADFIFPATNQIISEAARIRYRSNNDWNCPVVIRAPYGATGGGALYHSQCPESVFFGTPGLKMVAPSNPYDAKGLMKAAIRDADPVLFFEHKKCYLMLSADVPEQDFEVQIGVADVKREGMDLTVITYGIAVHYALQAAEELAGEGISAHVLDLRTIQPLDKEAILEAASKTGKVLIAHEDNKTGGIGAEVSAIIAEELLYDLDAPVMRLCGPDVPAVGMNPPMEKFFLLSTEKLKDAMRKLAQF
ncbi:2-oxoisovalerate dehydrogenase subunit beta [Paenibacillus larvae subsp. larvae]|uniref:Alpha-ketoacid dehydrogenase subunit beta n=2 Tax=Paenibacillus larvae TaxID=1464 RepID=A0A1U9YR17_9BACL|nr:alpha-ketoacid dehydrogenase subunit beta [Paenibacillus larvae]AQT86184.1 alpha-ketoacid dehydrogenase subunit beta [Paenibacillus larvae subsp. pulvifaciens]AQZ47802.1 alpha-ketoacid dehydrogenase subunit beta [Paenibacillus larvae subsp. pulvifaciens]ARF69564.1 alpha-ketoacid dehydrogenase subunit beta [Paenibacillus larvae subsp. pulvifaciens]AVF25686.1 2-oxoisovalerate dehydrogenase subunit beta [Paenibacillus larvae subsp. larvae]AVF30463.1 2-oxoisovalerate dehydrogenase subunit beta 